MFWSIDSYQKGYLLASATWLYRGLKCTTQWGDVFFKLSANQLLVLLDPRLRSKIPHCQRNCVFRFRWHHQVRFRPGNTTSNDLFRADVENQFGVFLYCTADHPKCEVLVVAYGRWSLTGIEPQGFSSEKKSGHIYFKEENLLHAISKLRHVQFHVVTKALRIF